MSIAMWYLKEAYDKFQYTLHGETLEKMKIKIRELTSRSNGWEYEYRKQRLQWYIRGWSNDFRLANYKNKVEKVHSHVYMKKLETCENPICKSDETLA